MAWTVRKIVEKAYGELGFASYAMDLQPEQLEAGRDALDAMVAEWASMGVDCEHVVGTALDADSATPDKWLQPLYANLAMRIAPSLGKEPSIITRQAATRGYQAIAAGNVTIPSRAPNSNATPLGAGNYSVTNRGAWTGYNEV